ncbi:hypothetical protein CCP4SC76_2280011 [Gammaproteobacteria bacterium]
MTRAKRFVISHLLHEMGSKLNFATLIIGYWLIIFCNQLFCFVPEFSHKKDNLLQKLPKTPSHPVVTFVQGRDVITPLVRALGLAFFWQGLIDSGKFKSLTEIAEAEGLHISRVRDFMRLTLLAPDLVVRMLGGTLPRNWSLVFLMRRSIPKDWEAQRGMMPAK